MITCTIRLFKSSLLILYYNINYVLLIATTPDTSEPKPYSFCNIGLKSGGWDKKSIGELLSERQKLLREHRDNVKQYSEANEELMNLIKAKDLDAKLPDKSKNWDMNHIIKFFDSFFDEDSGNTREEGIKELEDFLRGERKLYLEKCAKLKKDIEEIKTEYVNRKAAEEQSKENIEENIEENQKPIEKGKGKLEEDQQLIEKGKGKLEEDQPLIKNINTFLPIIPKYISIFYNIFLTTFTLCIYFKLIDLDLNYLVIHLPNITIPTIIISIFLFIWEYYRLYSKSIKYYKVGKVIYLLCKNKLYFLYKKLYFYYKKIFYKK